jgi:formate/nitrite transporter
MVVAGFLAGAYIAFAGIVSVTTTSGMDPEIWGTLPSLFSGAVFALGLILVVIAGSELLTGNMALVPLAAMRGRVPVASILKNLGWVLLGNLLGSLFVAYFLGVQTGVLTVDVVAEKLGAIADRKAVEESSWQIFLRGLGCNWLVCLAVWMALAAEDIAGKVLAIFFPIMAFVAIGFDHVVANMFFLPAALFAGVGELNVAQMLNNWLFAFLGNFAGALIFVAAAYNFLYGKKADKQEAGDTPRGSREAEHEHTGGDGGDGGRPVTSGSGATAAR